MANLNVVEGSSINRPPLFDGKAYAYWRDKMKLFVESTIWSYGIE